MRTSEVNSIHGLKVLFALLLMLILLTDAFILVASVIATGAAVFARIIGIDFLPLGDLLIALLLSFLALPLLTMLFNASVKSYHPSLDDK